MKRIQPRILANCLATLVASAGYGVAVAAESGIATQDLQNVMASDQVNFARWSRQPDAYVVQLELRADVEPPRNGRAPPDAATEQEVPDADRAASPRVSLTAEEMRRLGIVNVADALATLVPQNAPRRQPDPFGDERDGTARGSFFIGNTIANLRGLDPAFCGRTLTLIDGRRRLPGEPQAVPPPPQVGRTDQPYAVAVRDPRVEVWLLKADGTHIPPGAYRCRPVPAGTARTSAFDISYTYPPEVGELAVAAAIRVRDDFFIEKLQLLPSPAAEQ